MNKSRYSCATRTIVSVVFIFLVLPRPIAANAYYGVYETDDWKNYTEPQVEILAAMWAAKTMKIDLLTMHLRTSANNNALSLL